MKKKFISGLLSVLYAALMILGLFIPNGMASALVTALTWVACLLVWVAVLVTARRILGRSSRDADLTAGCLRSRWRWW